jgi:predicted TPR repeat methyltransferase
LRHHPRLVAALANLGLAWRVLGETEQARAVLESALALEPDDAELHFNLGAVFHDLGEREVARRHYEQACVLDPVHARAWNHRGIWHQECGELVEAERCYRQALATNPDDAETLNNLGTLLAAADRQDEAETAYRAALVANPGFAEACKNLAAVLASRGKQTEALHYFQEALRLKPELSEAAFKVAALSGETPATAPADYVAALFDDYAANYDRHLTDTLCYDVPAALARELAAAGVPPRLGRVLDLGCGTGLSGLVLRGFSDEITGIDLSARMLEQARARGVYAELRQGEIVAELQAEAPASAGLALAADVFVYMGDLAPVAQVLARVLRPGGWVAFSVESAAETGFRLQPTGRYAHSASYIEACWGGAGFRERSRTNVTLRVEQGQPVSGTLWVFRL